MAPEGVATKPALLTKICLPQAENPNGFGMPGVATACEAAAAPLLLITNVSISPYVRGSPRWVTTITPPLLAKPIPAVTPTLSFLPLGVTAVSLRSDPAIGVSLPVDENFQPKMFWLVSFTTYRRSPLLVRLIGSFPCDETWATSFGPDAVIWKELTLLSPAFTTNSSLPSDVRFTEPDESTIGKPNGAVPLIPFPPVDTTLRCVSVPLAARVNTITELPEGSLLVV